MYVCVWVAYVREHFLFDLFVVKSDLDHVCIAIRNLTIIVFFLFNKTVLGRI